MIFKPLIAEQKNWLVCHDCGALQDIVPLGENLEMACSNCGNPLEIGVGQWLDKTTALAFAAVILLISSNMFTFLTLKLTSVEQGITILSGVGALISREQWILASLVLVTIFLLPIFEAFALLYLLVPYRLQRRVPGQIAIFRTLVRLQPWIMLDVFLLGVLVTTVKLGDRATVEIGPGMPLFFALVCVLQMAYWFMNKNNLWGWLYPNNCFTLDQDETLYDCNICKAMVGESIVQQQKQCPRCNSPIYTRIPQSLQKTTALIVAAIILYIPANLFLIMKYREVGTNYDSTILSGVIDLANNGLWLVAIIVFIASIIVPIVKLSILIFLVWSVYTKMKWGGRQRVTLYRITEFIGRWSMVDVYVVTLLTASVQFGLMGVVEPGAALLPFAAVVVLTMMAAETFDPRLIWDSIDDSLSPPETRDRSVTQLLAESAAPSTIPDAGSTN